MINEKLEVLKRYLAETKETNSKITYNENENIFEVNEGQEYKVLTDEEADQEAETEIKELLWAFNPQFILKHTEFYKESTSREDEAFIKAIKLMQEKLCESANGIIKALIKDLGEFIEDAIDADGRGHFLSWYDGEEIEQDGYYIYRTN